MVVDFSRPLLDLDGELIKEAIPGVDPPKLIPTTLGRAVSNALVNAFDDERNLLGVDKVKRWALALKIRAASNLDLDAEDIALMKQCVAKSYGPVIVGQVWQILDPKK